MEFSLKAFTQNNGTFSSLKSILCLYLLFLSLILFYSQFSSLHSTSSSLSSASRTFFNQWKDAVRESNRPNHSEFIESMTVHTNHSEVINSMNVPTNHSEVIDPMTIPTNHSEVIDSMVVHTNHSEVIDSMTTKLQDPVTFLPLKDVRLSGPEAAMSGHTWFMSSINDTIEENEAEHLLFPSLASEGRVLCIKGHDTGDGTKNLYALAHPENLPDEAILMKGLTYVSNTYFNYQNLWHGFCALAPFVRWSIKNECAKPTRWLLYHWGESTFQTGSWIHKLMETSYREVNIEKFDRGEGPYCFEKAVVMRHDLGMMSGENRLKVLDFLRCKGREFCGFNPAGKGKEVNERGLPIIRLTLLIRRGSRSFKNSTVVFDIFSQECAKVDGCILEMIQSEDLSFCDQVKVLMNTDIVASPHGAQLTNMFYMDRESSVMEFFPKGWLELAGVGQYAFHALAEMSGMKHRGAWWDPNGEECPDPKDRPQCFSYHKDGKVGHNETYFAEWTSKVLGEVRISKQQKLNSTENFNLNATCVC